MGQGGKWKYAKHIFSSNGPPFGKKMTTEPEIMNICIISNIIDYWLRGNVNTHPIAYMNISKIYLWPALNLYKL